MTRARRSTRPGFTLLEAIIAITILASVVAACLQLRAATLTQAAILERTASERDAAQDLLELVRAGLLPGGQRDEATPGRVVWRGVRFGGPYECVVEPVQAPNPVLERVPREHRNEYAAAVTYIECRVRLGDVELTGVMPPRER